MSPLSGKFDLAYQWPMKMCGSLCAIYTPPSIPEFVEAGIAETRPQQILPLIYTGAMITFPEGW